MSKSKVYPEYIPENCSRAELKVRNAIENSEGLVAVHQVNWQTIRNGKPSDGEADFVILVPELGIITLEVKGGGIDVEKGRWYSTDRHGTRHDIKNPVEQAKDSKFALIHFINKSCPRLKNIKIVHAVAFPDITFSSDLGMDCPRNIVLDRGCLLDIKASVSKICDHWNAKSHLISSDIDFIVNKILPTKVIRRSFLDEIGEGNKSIIELTRQQVKVLRGLSRNARAVIIGGAGSGKTIMSIEKSILLAEQGFDVFLLCYNQLLKQHLDSATHDSKVRVETYHSLVESEAKKADIPLPVTRDEDWFENKAPSILIEAFIKNNTSINSLIIDEGQDFSNSWIESLHVAFRDENSPYYIFMDPHQDLYRRGSTIPKDMPCFELSRNCRNSTAIHEKVSKVYFDNDEPSGVAGPAPTFIEMQKKSKALVKVEVIVEDLFRNGVIASQIVVLTNDIQLLSQLRELIIEDSIVTRFGESGIHAETINRFKGLERDFVILVLSERASSELDKADCYVGFSRARLGLYVIAPRKFLDSSNWNA